MKILRVKAIAKKELIQIRRDPFSLAMAFLMPVILLFIYGYAITFDVEQIATVVYDTDKSSLSRELVAEFQESGYFRVVAQVDSYRAIDPYLDSGEARVAIVIPRDFSKDIHRGRGVQAEVLLDGGDSNTATIAQGYIVAISERFAQRVQGGLQTPLVDARSRVWYNTELKSRNFIIPGLIAVVMAVIIALLTSLTIAREWDRGTMEQLISTPVKTPELILGKLIPYFMIGFTDTILAILMSTLLFDVPLRGSITLLLFLSALFLFGGLSFGILISIAGRTQLVASQMAMLASFLPAFLLSGFIFSISNMPKPLQIITYFIPARYFVTILKGIFLKGSPLRLLLMETVLLFLFAVLVFVAATRKFRKRVE
ncbi:MAG: Inner membrane transport permease YbhS [Syntrophorhabdus sp. PtaU1.Bin153]|nr:MAG: Inner membrane transport permease YbhS [Syntrophorhabdus sp. PtaU1.Bin153]